MTDNDWGYKPKVGDIVEIIIYESVFEIGVVIIADNVYSHESADIIIQAKDGTLSSPWSNECVRLLTPLEIALW
jgi:hypothetical protein